MAKVKTKNRNLLTFFLVLIAFIIGLLCSFLLFNMYLTHNVSFGVSKDVLEFGIGEEIKIDNFYCDIKHQDCKDDVVITYYKDGVKVDFIDNTKEGTYLVKYEYNKDNYHLTTTQVVNIRALANLEVNFLSTGNKYTGDSIYIKAGETDILIDAGSRVSSSSTISDYLNGTNQSVSHASVQDNKLEYVIATHADQDHISAFTGSDGIFANYEVETIIDFPKTNKNTRVYKNYVAARDNLVQNGTNHYTALECYNNENGAQRVYDLAPGITLEILYNYYYEHETGNENNYSVCVLLTRGTDKYLLTGDLEAEGEEYLVSYYENEETLKDVYLFKAAHHGSYTGSTNELLSLITPEVVVSTCVAFSSEYTSNPDNMFPSKQAVNNFATNNVKHFYVTQMASNNSLGYEEANGFISVQSSGDRVEVKCSNKNNDFFDTEAFPIFGKYRSWIN